MTLLNVFRIQWN